MAVNVGVSVEVAVSVSVCVGVAVPRKPKKGGKAPGKVQPARNPKMINDVMKLLLRITFSNINIYQLNVPSQ